MKRSSGLRSLLTLVSLPFLITLKGITKVSAESQVECTVATILGTNSRGLSIFSGAVVEEDFEYVCGVDSPVTTYKIYGDVKSFVGPSYQSSKTRLSFHSSIIGSDKVIDLSNDLVKQLVSVVPNEESLPDMALSQAQATEGTFKALAIRVVDNTGDEPDESANEIYGAFFDDSINYGVSVVRATKYCLQISSLKSRNYIYKVF